MKEINNFLDNLKKEKDRVFKDNEKAINYFNMANTFLYDGDYKNAEENIKKYKDLINYDSFYKIDNRILNNNPKVSVIIVSYNTKEKLLECVGSLFDKNKNIEDFEVLVIDNGENDEVLEKLLKYNISYIQNPTNLILSEGRNIGANLAKGRIIAFLDDDALVGDGYVENIIKVFDLNNIVGLRGKILPKTNNQNNNIASHYNLGDESKNISSINTEGNSAFIKNFYLELGGMNPLFFGHEGIEISRRIRNIFGEDKILYSPNIIIYHDYADNENKLNIKNKRHEIMRKYLDYICGMAGNFMGGAINFNIKFSVIMPTYNRKHCIKDAIDSLLAQTYRNFELIVIDDGSTDETEEYLKETYKKEIDSGKISYIKLSENRGASFARNEGLKKAKNEWVAYLDTDNKMYPNFLETYVGYINENPNYKIFYAKIKYRNSGVIIGHEFNFQELLRYNYIDNNVIVHKINLFKEIGGYRTELDRLIDWDLIIRYTQKYNPFFINKVLIDYYDGKDFKRITSHNHFNKNFKNIIVNYFNNIPEYRFQEEYDKIFQSIDSLIIEKDLEIKTILNSTSWKITKPMRFIKDKLKKFFYLIKYSFVILKKDGIVSLIKRIAKFFIKNIYKNFNYK